MEYVIYLDVYFGANFFMDFLILIIIWKLQKYQSTFFRCFMGAAAGAGYACVILCLGSSLLKISGYFLFSILLMKWVYHICGVKEYIKGILFFFGIQFFLGGLLDWIYYSSGFSKDWFHYIMMAGLATLAVFVLYEIIKAVFLDTKEREEHLCDIILQFAGAEIKVKALVDTGNMLREPISHSPVSILEYRVLKEQIGEEEKICACFPKEKYRMVPFHSLGEENGMLPGVFANAIYIKEKEEMKRIEHPFIGIYKNSLSEGKDYGMILHPELLKNQEKRG